MAALSIPTPPSPKYRLRELPELFSSRILLLLLTLLSQSLCRLLQIFRQRREFRAHALQQRRGVLVSLRSVVHAEARRTLRRPAPQAASGVLPVFPQDVITHADVRQLLHVAVVIAHNPLQRVQARLLGRHAVAHVLDDRVCTRNAD